MNYIYVSVISILVSSGVFAVLIFVARKWITAHIEGSIKLDYDLKFEDYRRSLETKHEALLGQMQQAQTTAHAAFIQGQRVTAEHRVDAVKVVWQGMITVDKETPTAVSMLDILYGNEIQDMATKPNLRTHVDNIDMNALASTMSADPIESVRPFIGEACYAFYKCYRTVILRIAFLLQDDVKQSRQVRQWYKDRHIRRLLSDVLSPSELDEFNALPFGQVNWVGEALRQKILEHLGKIISGDISAGEGIDQARKIQAVVNEISPPYSRS